MKDPMTIDNAVKMDASAADARNTDTITVAAAQVIKP